MLIAAFLASVVAANLIVSWAGPAWSPLIAFVFIGMDLTLRDRIHDATRGSKATLAGLVAISGCITYVLNAGAGMIALASVCAFTVAMIGDWLAYSALRHKPYMVRTNGSNLVGAALDSLIFPTIAFGGFLPLIVLGQFAAKVAGGAVWAIILRKRAVA